MAGGSGSRMKSEVPKQFLEIEGEPIIIKTIKQFVAADPTTKLIVVIPQKHESYWDRLRVDHSLLATVDKVYGGNSRTESVRAGLAHIPDEGLVAIHDAVRPFVAPAAINASYESAKQHGCGIVAVSLKDSIREMLQDGTSTARDRDRFVLVQTPQTFHVKSIKGAYAQITGEYSDDATVFESAGHPIHLVAGSHANRKITHPEDI